MRKKAKAKRRKTLGRNCQREIFNFKFFVASYICRLYNVCDDSLYCNCCFSVYSNGGACAHKAERRFCRS